MPRSKSGFRIRKSEQLPLFPSALQSYHWTKVFKTCPILRSHSIGHDNGYPTLHYFGNPRHTQSMIAYMILTSYFWEFQWKLHCGNAVNIPYCRIRSWQVWLGCGTRPIYNLYLTLGYHAQVAWSSIMLWSLATLRLPIAALDSEQKHFVDQANFKESKETPSFVYRTIFFPRVILLCLYHRHIITLDWRLLLNALLHSVFPNSLHNSWRNDVVRFI